MVRNVAFLPPIPTPKNHQNRASGIPGIAPRSLGDGCWRFSPGHACHGSCSFRLFTISRHSHRHVINPQICIEITCTYPLLQQCIGHRATILIIYYLGTTIEVIQGVPDRTGGSLMGEPGYPERPRSVFLGDEGAQKPPCWGLKYRIRHDL